MKFPFMAATVIAASILLTGCGQSVEVAPSQVGRIITSNGFKAGVVPTSKFRLDACWSYCDRLVVMDVADQSMSETMELFMPKDKLNMKFDLRLTLAVKPSSYEEMFDRIPAEENGVVSLSRAYKTYAQQVIRSEAREYLSNYTIAEIASSREAINAELSTRLSKSINEKTPFSVRYVGLADIQYPDIIVKAQEAAAERREQIQREEAMLQVSKVQLERELQEQEMRRKIEVEKARAESETNKILAESVTPAYVKYRSLNIMEKMTESDNKVFVPAGMLDDLSTQVMLGRQ